MAEKFCLVVVVVVDVAASLVVPWLPLPLDVAAADDCVTVLVTDKRCTKTTNMNEHINPVKTSVQSNLTKGRIADLSS